MHHITEKPGQGAMIGFQGTSVSDELSSFIIENGIWGVILFQRNVISLKQVQLLCRQLHQLGESLPHGRLCIGIDYEGGMVQRLRGMLPDIPSALAAGVSNDRDAYYEVIFSLSQVLSQLGIDLNFAPCVDLYRPRNAQLMTRCYSQFPEKVRLFGEAFVSASLAAGIVPCIKHFPGLGDCLRDTHHHSGVVSLTKEALNTHPLAPFKALIDAEAPMVMINHAAYPQLTGSDELPASLSSTVMQRLLRDEMGFLGVCVTDDMDMAALTLARSIDEAYPEALRAGADVVLLCHDQRAQVLAFEGLQRAAEKGQISEARLLEAWERRDRLPITQRRRSENQTHAINTHTLKSLEQRAIALSTRAVQYLRFERNERSKTFAALTSSPQKGALLYHLPQSYGKLYYKGYLSQCDRRSVLLNHQYCGVFSEKKERVVDSEIETILLIGQNWPDSLNEFITRHVSCQVVIVLTGDPAEADLIPSQIPTFLTYDPYPHLLGKVLEILLNKE